MLCYDTSIGLYSTLSILASLARVSKQRKLVVVQLQSSLLAYLEEVVWEEAPEQTGDDAIVGGGDGTTDDSQRHFEIISRSNVLTLQGKTFNK